MIKANKRATIYLDSQLHKILKIKAVETSRSISDLVNDAVRHELMEDQEDLETFEKRAKESTVSYEALLKELKADGRV